MQPDAVRDHLQEGWTGISSAGVQALATRLLEFEPTSLIRYKDSWHLRLSLQADSDFERGDNFYLPNVGQLKHRELDSRIEEFNGVGPVLVELALLFDGLAELPPDGAGHFLGGWTLFKDTAWSEPGIYMEQEEKWLGALVVYTCPDGDLVLVTASGELAWCDHEMSQITPYNKSLDAHLVDYTEFNRHYHGCLDWPVQNFAKCDFVGFRARRK